MPESFRGVGIYKFKGEMTTARDKINWKFPEGAPRETCKKRTLKNVTDFTSVSGEFDNFYHRWTTAVTIPT